MMMRFAASFSVPGNVSAIEIDHNVAVAVGKSDFTCEIMDLERGSRRVRLTGETRDAHALKAKLDASLLPKDLLVWTLGWA